MVVNKRHCIDDAVINYNYIELLPQDHLRFKVDNYIYSKVEINKIVNTVHNYKRIGKNAKCIYEKIVYIQALAELFRIIKEQQVCSTEDNYSDIAEEYKFECIRENLACRYGLGGMIEELTDLLGLQGAKIGIGYMTIQAPDAEPDCSPFQPTNPNGQ